jgi:hypothetical protein
MSDPFRIGSVGGTGALSPLGGHSNPAKAPAAQTPTAVPALGDRVQFSPELCETGSSAASHLASAWGNEAAVPEAKPDPGFTQQQGPRAGFSAGTSFNAQGGSCAAAGFGAGSVFATPPLR